MNKALLGVVAVAAVVQMAVQASVAFACTSDGKNGIAPENDLYIPASKFSVYTISQADFDDVNAKTLAAYTPVFAAQGRTYKVIADWDDGTVNAYANRSGKTSEVHMFGGLARHPKMTKDGFQLVICHETGHHLGGAPRKGTSWAANEGQADYYATFACARKMWAADDNAAVIAKMTVPAVITETCGKSFSTANDVAICVRSTMAGKDLGDTLGDLGRTGDTDVTTPDTSVVRETDDEHPEAQCRLDTYFAGAVCAKPAKDVLSNTDATAEACSMEMKDAVGFRPLCWYKPSDSRGPTPPEPKPDGGGSKWPSIKLSHRAQAAR